MNRRDLIKVGIPATLLGHSSNLLSATDPFANQFTKTKMKKNVVLVTVDFGLFEGNYREGKEKCHYSSKFFQPFKDEMTYFNHMYQPGLKDAHSGAHATFTGMLYSDRDLYPNRPFISLDQHLAEYTIQETRHKSIYHKIGGGGNCSYNSLAQPTPSFKSLDTLHENLFGYTDMGKVKQDIAKKRFILKEIYNNTKRRWKGTREEKDLLDSIDYKIDDLDSQVKWLKVRKPKITPKFDKNAVKNTPLKHIDENFNTVFNALENEQTKVALMQFGGGITRGLEEITYGHHGLGHHGYDSQKIEQLTALDSYVMRGLANFLDKLKTADMLDDTIVLFTCAASCSNTHSTRDIPAFLFGGGFNHKKCIECQDENKNLHTPTVQLLSSILKQVGFKNPSFSGNKKVIDSLFS